MSRAGHKSPPLPMCWRVPQTQAADDRVAVVAATSAGRQPLRLLCVPSPEHDVVGFTSRLHYRLGCLYVMHPPPASQPYETARADVVLEGSAAVIGKMRELERHEDSFDDECRTESGTESEKQHATALICAER